MKKKFYIASGLLSILLMGCNNPDNSTPIPESKEVTQKVVSHNVVQNSVVQDMVETPKKTVSKVKYIDKPIVTEEGMLYIKGFMGSIKPTLNSALKQDGNHVTAMSTCSSMATQMTNEYNNITNGVKIRRTALKYRNPKNKPDETDKEVMYRFQAVNDFKPVAVDMGNTYRVYKPLKTKASCLYCHGSKSDINPKIAKMIQKKYPHDLATDFKLGELRGVVVAEFKK